jgi:hypothetical protein
MPGMLWYTIYAGIGNQHEKGTPVSKLEKRKTKLTFETADEMRERGRYRQVIVEAKPTFAVLRLKGTRKTVTITWAGIYNYATRLEVEHALALKAAAKKEADKMKRRAKP